LSNIYLSSLPVGHTHEDIDAAFGTIADWFDRIFIHTPQEYAKQIKKSFNAEAGSYLNCEVEDVFLIPNYKLFLKDCIDVDYSRLHKDPWTQHQVRFEAVTISEFFPNGAKVTYRKFSSDKVVIIDKKPMIICRTDVGVKTGLEPKTVLSCWYPTPNLYSGRPVEGTYILNLIPSIPVTSTYMVPCDIVQGSRKVLEELRDRIFLEYDASQRRNEREEWKIFF
jgi:hypothetical protein